jgi:DNA-binding CsgD family transcriptional regulator
MLVGREAETAAIDRLLASAREGHSGVLVLRGEAGIGKSALLDHALANANEFTVLRCVGIESESELAYAALHQMLRPVLDHIDRIPEPQALSLRVAFALSDETEDDRFRVSLGALSILAEAAEQQPVLCLVDDAQWLDQASADAFVFVARRLEAESLVLLFAAREDDARPFLAQGLPELQLSLLTPIEARRFLAERLGSAVVPGVVDWIAESANGNPLALVELPVNLTERQLAGQDPLTGRLVQATSVEQVYLERVAGLPESVRTLLVLTAAEETGARTIVERAANELGLDMSDLSAAESVGLLRVDAEQLVFRHPLVRSAIYRGARFTERERAHRMLAAASAEEGSADRAAWHRAAATVGTNEDVADELERTAERARLRSGHGSAAAALARAADLTPDTNARARRLVGAASAAWQAGRPERASALLESASPIVSDPLVRVELDHLRGVIGFWCGDLLEACETLMAAAADAARLDPRKSLEILFDAAEAAGWAGNFARMADVGQRAGALPLGESRADIFLSDLLAGVGGLFEGKTAEEVPLILEVIAHADDFDEPRWLVWVASAAGSAGDEAREAALLKRAVALARESGAVDTLTHVLVTVAATGLFAGRAGVLVEAAEGLTLAREAGLPNGASMHLAVLAWFAALKGEDANCRAWAAEVNELARTTRNGFANSIANWAVALLDLSRGRPDEAITRLAEMSAPRPGVNQPYIALTSAPDLVEACVRTGRDEQARTAYAVFEGFARPGAPTWALALAARCRALLSQGAAAEHEFADASRLHSEVDRPFDQARTELLYGEFLRRERRRTEARQHLRAVLETFERLQAEPWAERARAELRASGETARKRDPSTLADLTPQELQIARLVGEGFSNKDVAGQLFLSPRTVEYHLRKVFMKLGISSRGELIKHGVTDVAEHAEAALAGH